MNTTRFSHVLAGTHRVRVFLQLIFSKIFLYSNSRALGNLRYINAQNTCYYLVRYVILHHSYLVTDEGSRKTW